MKEFLIWFSVTGVTTILILIAKVCFDLTKHTNCKHEETRYLDEPWPDGGAIEVCVHCGMSRHHWEQGHSHWVMIKDIENARREVQKAFDNIVTSGGD